ncbi:intracellular protein transport protein USO1 isoform X1 [Lathyrus oleraceus]|nr:intracellular protein transport protein USO1-like isoform X1 [Pisum sativum]
MGDSPHNRNLIKQHQLRIYEQSQSYLREQNLSLLRKLNQKEKLLQRHKSEPDMNARALKKFELENQKLASACQELLDKGNNLEKEIALYEHDREALMEFGNEADEREQQARSSVLELERNLQLVMDELKNYKHQKDLKAGSSSTCTAVEKNLLDSLLETLPSKDDDSTHAFLKANLENESCKRLLSMWNCLKPSTHRVLSLVSKIKSLQKDKEHLRINLHKAEEEVKLLFDENSILDKENKRLLKKYKERNHPSSGEKHTSSQSAKSNKRKSSPRTNSPVEQKVRNDSNSSEKHTTSPSAKSSKTKCSPRTSRSSAVERKIDFDDIDSARQPLSPLANNSPDCRIHKK